MAQDVVPSELIAGKYRLTRLLGRGGMGSVWEGIHITLGNRVACKFIEPEFVSSQDAVQRFENEARAAASLKSKHVVDVYDHGIMPDGRPYIVMEFLAGEPLDARLTKVGTLPLAQTASIIQQVSRALHRAHSAGIIHRDLKPENVFLVWDDEDHTDLAKVVDFGIAKFTDRSSTGLSSATRTGSIMGTPYYMSPEQARGLKNVDARSDIWSLGIIAYELLTGVRPYDGEAVGDILVKICTVAPVPPSQLNPSLPQAIDPWMMRALAQDPAQRFQDVRELADTLVTLAGVTGRNTLGSAVNSEGRGASANTVSAAPHTTPAGTPTYARKKTSGALTNAAVQVPADMATVPVRKNSPLIWIGGIGAAAIALIAFLLGSSGPDADQAAAQAAASALTPVSAPAPTPVEVHLPDPEPAAPAVVAQEPEPADEPRSAPEEDAEEARTQRSTTRRSSPAPRPSMRAVVAPRPQVAPTPAPAPPPPAPSPRPAPAPRPSSSNLDLGY